MAITLSRDVLCQYYRFSLYNSPFDAHEEGCAIDLYPETERAPSPVAGTTLDTMTVRAPPREYAADNDHLILVDTGDAVARLLHIDPAVEPVTGIALFCGRERFGAKLVDRSGTPAVGDDVRVTIERADTIPS